MATGSGWGDRQTWTQNLETNVGNEPGIDGLESVIFFKPYIHAYT